MAAVGTEDSVPLDVLVTAPALPERTPVVGLERILDEDAVTLRAGGGNVQRTRAAVWAPDHDHDTRI